MHRHKIYDMPDDWNFTDQCAVRYILEKLAPIVEGEPAGPEEKKIFRKNSIPPRTILSLAI